MSEDAKELFLRDDDGDKVYEGDTIRFSYGIPPRPVIAKVVRRGNSLIALTPGHTPDECNLRSLRRYVSVFYKEDGE